MAEKELFPGQGRDERVIIYERRHWFTLIQWLWRPFTLLLISLLAAWGLTRLLRGAHVSPFPTLALLWAIAVVPGLSWTIWRFLDWGNDRYIVTDQRVIHIEKKYFIREERRAAPLGMIQDVSAEMPGIMANLLYFGDVIIQTAGTLGTIRFAGIPKPRKAQVQIMTLVAQARGAEQPKKDEALETVRKIVGWPPPEPKPLPPAAEGLRWESEKPRREQLWVMFKRMLFPVVAFGENQKVWRKHWWLLLKEAVSPLLAFALLFVLWLSASVVFGPSLWFDVPLGISWAVVFVWLLWRTIDWRNDLYILTDDRVVDIEKVPFRYEHRREASLDKIQDVSYLQEGFLAKTLDFGNVRLETAGEIGAFTFDYVPHPKEVQVEIFRRLEQFRARAWQEEKRRRQEEFLELLARYHQGVSESGDA